MEYIKSIDKIPDYLKCPICLEVPRNRVFQCIEGHPICEECNPKVDSCPQCRDVFGSTPIRARIIERMLDELKLECKYEAQGCTKGFDRKNFNTLPEHEEYCHFNTEMFGPLIPVCKNIGLENCTFQMNGGNGVEAVQHFESTHQAWTSASDTLAIELPNFLTSSGVGAKPIILNMREAGYAFLIMFGRDSASSRFLNWAPFYIRYPSTGENKHSLKTPEMLSTSCQVKCSILGDHTLTLATKPLDILNHGERKLSSIWQRIYMAEPESDKSSGSVFAKVKVRKLFTPTGNDDNPSFTTIDLIQTCQNCLVKHDLINPTCATCETVNPNYIKRVGGEGATDSPQLEDSASEDDELANSLPSPLTGFGDEDGKGNPTTGTNIDFVNSPGTSLGSSSSRPDSDSDTCLVNSEESEMSPQPISTTVRYIDTIRLEDITSGSSTYNSLDTAARFRLEKMKRPINRIQKGRNTSKIQLEKMRESSS